MSSTHLDENGHVKDPIRLFEEFVNMQIDPVTGLIQRRLFFVTLVNELRAQFPHFETTGLTFKGVSTLVVFMGDIAYLNFFNDISHSEGDAMLQRVARILDSHFSSCWVARFGGDEMGLWSNHTPLDILLSRKQAVEDEIAEEPYDRIDIEYATVSDAREFYELGGTTEMSYSGLAQLLFDIAAARAQITKCYQRILFFVQLRLRNDTSYEQIVLRGRKGAGDISDNDITYLVEKMRDGVNIVYECLAYAIKTRQEKSSDTEYRHHVFTVASKTFYRSV